MSGSIGGKRIRREEVQPTLDKYIEQVLSKMPGFVSAQITGSYNAGTRKDHGDIDLAVHIKGTNVTQVKKAFKAHLDGLDLPEFASGKNQGKKSQLYGAIVTCGFPISGREEDYVQIDNIIVTNENEQRFQRQFLDLDAAKQGLVMGYMRTILHHKDADKILEYIGLSNLPKPSGNQEYEFVLSSAGLSFRLVTLNSDMRETNREELWRSANWDLVEYILSPLDLSKSYEELLDQVAKIVKNDNRSKRRIVGIMKSMIRVGPGEVGTPKGDGKIAAIERAETILKESSKMIGLYQYLVESAALSKKFNRRVKTINDIQRINDKVYILNSKYGKLINSISQKINATGCDEPFIVSTTANYIKIHPDYAGIVRAEVEKDSTLSIKVIRGDKFIVKDTTDRNKTIIEIGRGSVGRISTESQEKSTCQIFNDIIEHYSGENIYDLLKDKDYIFNLISDLYENSDDLDKTWIYSFGKQVGTIIKYLESLDLQVKNYRAVRFGDKSDSVGSWYTNMINSYTQIVGGKGTRKDTFDPTDIILYDKTYTSLPSIKLTPDNVNEIKEDYLENIFKKHIIMGVSLKKISRDGQVEVFNVDQNIQLPAIQSVDYIRGPEKDNNVTLVINGDFRFNTITDSTGNAVGEPSSLLLTLRTFGTRIAMDLSINEKYSPAIGKVPVSVWRGKNEGIDCKSKDIKVCVKSFRKWFDSLSENERKTKIARLIQAAAKEGPSCFPFILVH